MSWPWKKIIISITGAIGISGVIIYLIHRIKSKSSKEKAQKIKYIIADDEEQQNMNLERFNSSVYEQNVSIIQKNKRSFDLKSDKGINPKLNNNFIPNICDILDEILLNLYAALSNSQAETNFINAGQVKIELKEIQKKNENNYNSIYDKVVEEILVENKIRKEEWNFWIKENETNPSIKGRLHKLEILAMTYKKNEKLKLIFDIPSQLSKQQFEIIHKKIVLSYNYFLQIQIQKLKDSKNESSNQKEKNKIDYEEIQKELEKRKINLMNNIGIFKKNGDKTNKFYQNYWGFALHNFSQDEDFKIRRQEISFLSQFLSKKINEGVYFQELQFDPINKTIQDLDEVFKQIASRKEDEEKIKPTRIN